MVIKFLVFDLIKCYPQPILQPEYVDEVSSSTLVKGPWPHKPCPRDLGHLPRGHKQLLPTSPNPQINALVLLQLFPGVLTASPLTAYGQPVLHSPTPA